MLQNIRTIAFSLAGFISIVLSVKCYSMDELNFELSNLYGGDAYTGIQNAAAMTSRNVKELAEIVQFGFGSILLVMGLTLMAVGLIHLAEHRN